VPRTAGRAHRHTEDVSGRSLGERARQMLSLTSSMPSKARSVVLRRRCGIVILGKE
jgi:hypothetical protein